MTQGCSVSAGGEPGVVCWDQWDLCVLTREQARIPAPDRAPERIRGSTAGMCQCLVAQFPSFKRQLLMRFEQQSCMWGPGIPLL